jgi:hypothetical protein
MSEAIAEELQTYRSNMERLIKLVGEKGNCRYCGAGIWWVRHKVSAAMTPYHEDGTPHLARCVSQRFEKFREQHKLI